MTAEKKSRDPFYILIIDDSEDDVEATRRAFRQAGLETPLQHASTGEDALALLKSGKEGSRPSLILLDLNMPGIGGRKTLEILKQDQYLKNTPVVVLSSSSYEEDVRTCYALGANTFISKPVSFTVFAREMKQLMDYWTETALLPPSLSSGTR